MPFEQKPFTGVFFPNNFKKTDQQPDFKGPYLDRVDGKLIEREIAVWKRTGIKDGKPYFSFKIGDKFNPGNKSHAQASSKQDNYDDGGEVPF